MKSRKYFFQFLLILIYFIFIYIYFKDIIYSKGIVLDLSFKKIDFKNEDPLLWKRIINYFHISNIFLLSIFFIQFLKNCIPEIYIYLKKTANLNPVDNLKRANKNENLKKLSKEELKQYLEKNRRMSINIGVNDKKELINIEGKALFQNILITGSIGSGKTQSAILPITEQILKYNCGEVENKVAALILDVKGNFCKSVEEICKRIGREEDIIKIEIGGKYKYNPLYKENLKPQVIAERLKTILLLLNSENGGEMYWIDKANQLISECIKFIRLYNDGYVNFYELSKIIFDQKYYKEKRKSLKKLILEKKLTKEEIFNLNSFLNYYEHEFLDLDQRTSAIIKSEISRITNIFISDYEINKTFSPSKEEINFHGFKEMLDKGKIVVLNMNLSENTILAKIIASYLKLDFQGEVLSRLKEEKNTRISAFICDEYQEYVTKTDASFYAQSREARCINIVSTQSYTSLQNTLKDKESCEVIIQNLLNKIWLRNDDKYTVDSAIDQIGKIYKEKISKSISENSKDSEYNYFLKKFVSTDSNLSESINKSMDLENRFEVKDFTQNLKIFEAIVFLSNDDRKIILPEKIQLIPSFKRKEIYEKRKEKQ